MRKGVRARPANRVAQYVDMRHQQIRTGVAQVHCKEEGSARNPIAAIIRHTGSIPDLSKRRKALRFSALRLLWPTSHRLVFHLVAMSRTAPSYVKLFRLSHSTRARATQNRLDLPLNADSPMQITGPREVLRDEAAGKSAASKKVADALKEAKQLHHPTPTSFGLGFRKRTRRRFSTS
jgi:hypothetical protein